MLYPRFYRELGAYAPFPHLVLLVFTGDPGADRPSVIAPEREGVKGALDDARRAPLVAFASRHLGLSPLLVKGEAVPGADIDADSGSYFTYIGGYLLLLLKTGLFFSTKAFIPSIPSGCSPHVASANRSRSICVSKGVSKESVMRRFISAKE